MVLPIYAYGQRVLKKEALPVDETFENLSELISDMWETMYYAKGIGIAAPQIGKSIRIFLIDTIQYKEEDPSIDGIKKAFINAEIIEEFGEENSFEEGCLSIPDVRGDVTRLSSIKIKYYDESFNEFEEVYHGMNARVIQHEYDHIEGILFTEYLQPLKKRMIKRKLEAIKNGKVKVDYRMRFTQPKK